MKKIVVAVTGASGSIYAKRLMEYLDKTENCQYDAVMSKNATDVWKWELGEEPQIQGKCYANNDYFAPFASGSSRYDAMVIVPASMGTLGRIASGISDNLITRAADVFLKERRKIIAVFRETPLNSIHLENLLKLSRSGMRIFPASPSFYHHPKSVEEAVDTVIFRVLDHLEIPVQRKRWGE